MAAYALAVRFFPRLGVHVPPLAPFGQLRLPFALVWTFAAGLLLAIVGRALAMRAIFLAGVNLAIVHGAASQRLSRRYACGMINLRPDRDGRIRAYEGLEKIEQMFGEWMIDSHLPPVGSPTAGDKDSGTR